MSSPLASQPSASVNGPLPTQVHQIATPSGYSRFPNALRDTKIQLHAETFGRAKVDCALLMDRARWGLIPYGHAQSQQHGQQAGQTTVGQQQPQAGAQIGVLTSAQSGGKVGVQQTYQPAGVLYMQLYISDMEDYQLRYVEVKTEFANPKKQDVSPLVDAVHPKAMAGDQTRTSVSRRFELSPEVDAGVGSGKLGSYGKTSENEEITHWTFKGRDDVNEAGHYSNVIWTWEDPKRRSPVSFGRPITAAVVVRHDTQPFIIKASVDGKLTRHVRHVLRKLMFRPTIRQSNPIPPESSTEELQSIIDGLAAEIDAENRGQAMPVYPSTTTVP